VATRRFMPPPLPLEQLPRLHPQGLRDADDVDEAGVVHPALDPADIGAGQVAARRDILVVEALYGSTAAS
jgi:hypothetical protein